MVSMKFLSSQNQVTGAMKQDSQILSTKSSSSLLLLVDIRQKTYKHSLVIFKEAGLKPIGGQGAERQDHKLSFRRKFDLI